MLAATEPPTARIARAARPALAPLSVAGLGAVVLPAVATVGVPVHAPVWQAAVGVLVAGVAVVTAGHTSRRGYERLAGVAMVGTACWLLAQASYPVAAWVVAPTLGLGIALACGGRNAPLRANSISAVDVGAIGVGAAALVGLRVAVGRDAATAASALLVSAGAVSAVLMASNGPPLARGRRMLLVLGPLLALGTAGYIGATTPSATWFGSLTHHGPRGGDEVALTFDDGPNPPYTLQISGILDSYGVKGTFFTVGKALEARPDVSKALLDDGQLLGNHSYTHDAVHWLDPGYAELGETQDAFDRTLGVCPTFYRPPHGSHTPFMAKVVSDANMKMVTWDVSADDWATTDGAVVAKRVLDKVKPGSIILLHDGIDGNIGADRSVILQALPLILDGLRARGLKPVTLDKLLGVPGYVGVC